jgi:hypothetical protein
LTFFSWPQRLQTFVVAITSGIAFLLPKECVDGPSNNFRYRKASFARECPQCIYLAVGEVVIDSFHVCIIYAPLIDLKVRKGYNPENFGGIS